MRALLLAIPLSLIIAHTSLAGDSTAARAPTAKASEQPADSKLETYRGYVYDLSEIAGRQDISTIEASLRHQLDIVESVGLSPRVLTYFHTIPVVADEMACFPAEQSATMERPLTTAGCYGQVAPRRPDHTMRQPSVWDSAKGKWTNANAIDLAEDLGRGIVMVRPLLLGSQNPVVLHELLHAFHAHMLPHGFENQGIEYFYSQAKKGDLYPADSYLLTNSREFFAVTASVFLFGQDDKEPFTRAKLKEKLPEYYKYLAWLFEFDPDPTPRATPVASAN